LISHEFELFDLDIRLENIGNLGIEKQPDGVFLERKLYVMVVRSMDDKIEVYFNGLYIFIAIGDDDGECLLVEFLERGGKVHLRALIPLNNHRFTVI
jgi:hypothetical protein